MSFTVVVDATSTGEADTLRSSLAEQTPAEMQQAIRTAMEGQGLGALASSTTVTALGTPIVPGEVSSTTTTAPIAHRVHKLNAVAGIAVGACLGAAVLAFAIVKRSELRRMACRTAGTKQARATPAARDSGAGTKIEMQVEHEVPNPLQFDSNLGVGGADEQRDNAAGSGSD